MMSVSMILHASSVYVLGNTHHQIPKNITTKNSIIVKSVGSTYSISHPIDNLKRKLNSQTSFILLNNDSINYTTSLYTKKFFLLKRGWNRLSTPKNGVDIVKTFQTHKDVKFIFVYDRLSHAWAGYSPSKNLQDKIESTRILSLKYIEPNLEFFVLSSKDISVTIISSKINAVCQKFIDSKEFGTLVDTAFKQSYRTSKNDSIGIKTRYFSHQKRGEYSDSRVVLIYPKIDIFNKTKLEKYGPAEPKVFINYDKAYEEKKFYIYDFFHKSCYKGIFPSKRVPPFSTLIKL